MGKPRTNLLRLAAFPEIRTGLPDCIPPQWRPPVAEDDWLYLNLHLRRVLYFEQRRHAEKVTADDRGCAQLTVFVRDEIAQLEVRGLIEQDAWSAEVTLERVDGLNPPVYTTTPRMRVYGLTPDAEHMEVQGRAKWGLKDFHG